MDEIVVREERKLDAFTRIRSVLDLLAKKYPEPTFDERRAGENLIEYCWSGWNERTEQAGIDLNEAMSDYIDGLITRDELKTAWTAYQFAHQMCWANGESHYVFELKDAA